MANDERTRLERRVAEAAQATLNDQRFVSVVDVFLRLGWLAPSHVDAWRQGRVDDLEAVVNAGPGKLVAAIDMLHRWADDRGLIPRETAYISRTRDRRPLRFSADGRADVEVAYRTHWVSPDLSAREQQRLTERASKPPDLVVIDPLNEIDCTDCGQRCDLLLMEDAGPLCLACADLDHLVFLPSGDATLTRRAKGASRLAAVVVRFSRRRKRYERQGVLVEEEALEDAERRCLDDAEARARRRERDRARRAAMDEAYVEHLTDAIRSEFPGCSPVRARAIARHTATKGSGRVGRTAAARDLDPRVIDLAVAASVRHLDTSYDDLLMAGIDRREARATVRPEVDATLRAWRTPPAACDDRT